MTANNFEIWAQVAILLIPFLFFSFNKKRPNEHNDGSAPTKESRFDSSTAKTATDKRPEVLNITSAPTEAPRFDSSTAKTATENLVISGPARVVDGDTIMINKTSIRLFGIDAPEMNHPYGQKAKWAMVNLCKGQTVRSEITETDAHGRSVGKCTLPDGRDLSAELVKLGLAIDWPKFSGGIYKALEVPGVRKKLWLADARQKGRMHVWEQFDYEAYRAKKAIRK